MYIFASSNEEKDMKSDWIKYELLKMLTLLVLVAIVASPIILTEYIINSDEDIKLNECNIEVIKV